MALRYQRLYINIDHVATVRQARRGLEPDPVAAALLCEKTGVDGITAHLREDRRHIQDDDIHRLMASITTILNLECANTDDILSLAETVRPAQVTLVPERREEITTEGGLDVAGNMAQLGPAMERMRAAGIRTSLFIDPEEEQIRMSRQLQADAIELHTGRYANHPGDPASLEALRRAAELASGLGLAVHAGHGLSVANVGPVAAIAEIEELNIGHSIIGRAIFVGLEAAVREIREAMDEARSADRF